jgi:hypothetical protein
MSQECPHCGLLSPDEARRCDCGYDFTARSLESPHLQRRLADRSNVPRFSVNFIAAFFVHLGAATVSAFAGVVVSLVLGLAGRIELFAPVVAASSLTGWFMPRRLNPVAAAWVWVPAAIWFVGWAFASFSLGLDHFTRVFVGIGYCGDFACAGQWFVTSPLVGSISYVAVVRWEK